VGSAAVADNPKLSLHCIYRAQWAQQADVAVLKAILLRHPALQFCMC